MNKTLLTLALSMASVMTLSAEQVVFLTTNDTHSNVVANPDGTAGVAARKAIVDSVRRAEKNVVLIDAGDMVQGSLFFKYFRGDVEYPLFNMMDYDIRILGNHEFDNGLEELARNWSRVKGDRLSANYDFSETPARGLFKPYVIKKIGGKKIGFVGINIDPDGLISADNYAGMKYTDAIEAANHEAEILRSKKGCDLVVAVTHIGYEQDKALARASKDIDIIIGGHSHTFVDPDTPDSTPYWINNAQGRPVLVTQTGKYGRNVGYVKVDLDKLKNRDYTYRHIPVTDRFATYDKTIADFIAPYSNKVDSVNNHIIAMSDVEMTNVRNGAYGNWVADYALNFGRHIADSLRVSTPDFPAVDMGIMNIGGIRHPMSQGVVTEGQILSTFPFSNRMQLIKVKGEDIISALTGAAAKGGEAISANVRVVTDGDKALKRVVVNGIEIDPDRDYIVSTIDYIAQGNDGLDALANHEIIWSDSQEMSVRILDYLRRHTDLGLPIQSDPSPRFVKEITIQ